MIDARAAKLSDWTAVIGYPRDGATITQQIGARRSNHDRACCYRYKSLPEPSLPLSIRFPVSLDKGNEGSGNEIVIDTISNGN